MVLRVLKLRVNDFKPKEGTDHETQVRPYNTTNIVCLLLKRLYGDIILPLAVSIRSPSLTQLYIWGNSVEH